MLFLACGLFDTSSGTSSTPTTTTAQASSERVVREAFAEFDRAFARSIMPLRHMLRNQSM